MTRQKLVGWLLIVVSGAYLVYFLKVRLLTPGPFIDKREWLHTFGSLAALMLGIMNVRLAARNEKQRTARLSK